MSRVDADEERIKQQLNDHWEVIGEGVQTVLRAAGHSDAYELLKSQLRGQPLNEDSYRRWVEALDINSETRARLLDLSPETYIGLAVQIVDEVLKDMYR
jgi:adenylosuccinate lyase